jgi:hypothetical protein
MSAIDAASRNCDQNREAPERKASRALVYDNVLYAIVLAPHSFASIVRSGQDQALPQQPWLLTPSASLDGQADAEMSGLDSSSSSKQKMACMWRNSRPRPGLSVIQEGPDSSRKTRRVSRHFS